MTRLRLALALLLALTACTLDGQLADDKGIGGTGITAGESGIGGTGIRRDGGLGFLGTVTAMGSIWVNGSEIELPMTAILTLEGAPIAASAIGPGHVAAVLAQPGPAGIAARSVDIRLAVAGPISAARPGTLTILGQTVETRSDTVLTTAIAPGAWVAVSGLRRPDGSILASRIDARPPAQGWVLRGRAEPVQTGGQPGQVRMAGQMFALPPGVRAPAAATLRLAGHRLGLVPLAETLTVDAANPFGAEAAMLSLESYIDARGIPLAFGDEAGGLLDAAAAIGSRAVVEASVSATGQITAATIAGPAPALGQTTLAGARGGTQSGGPQRGASGAAGRGGAAPAGVGAAIGAGSVGTGPGAGLGAGLAGAAAPDSAGAPGGGLGSGLGGAASAAGGAGPGGAGAGGGVGGAGGAGSGGGGGGGGGGGHGR